jgi:hypothetical protein
MASKEHRSNKPDETLKNKSVGTFFFLLTLPFPVRRNQITLRTLDELIETDPLALTFWK